MRGRGSRLDQYPPGMALPRIPPRFAVRARLACAVAALAGAAAVIAVADSWRTAIAAVVAAAALVATRIRFASALAGALLVAVAALSLGGHAVARSRRPTASAGVARQPPARGAHAERRRIRPRIRH
jgi:hypothetical protein